MLDLKPELYSDLAPVWRAFFELHRSRQPGISPLLCSEISAYMDIQGIDDVDDRRELYDLVIAMDAAWLKMARERQPKT